MHARVPCALLPPPPPPPAYEAGAACTVGRYKLTNKNLILTTITNGRCFCNFCGYRKNTRNVDLASVVGVSTSQADRCFMCGCDADYVQVHLGRRPPPPARARRAEASLTLAALLTDESKQLEPLGPLAVTKGSAPDVALKIQDAMEAEQQRMASHAPHSGQMRR